MNFKTISRNIGYALLVSALFMLLSIFVSMANGNDSALAALIISFTITFIVGIFPFIFVRKTSRISLKEGYVIIVLSWVLSFIFGMLPYALWGGPFTLQNAWFESVSGFTTSGATILDNIEALPDSLLFWRSSTHFIGGLGVVVFLLLIIPDSSPIRMRLTNMELSSLSKDTYNVRTNKTVFVFAYVYLAIAVSSFLCYWAAGMTAFDAINHAFSVCATGGFSTKNLSIASFDSRLIEGITMFFMFIGSLHFGLLFMTVANKSFRPLNNPVLKFYLLILILAVASMTMSLKMNGVEASWGDSIWTSMFHVLSTSSTTGFAIADNSSWPMQTSIIILMAGVMCGCAGSTTGAIKADRILVLFKSIGRQVNKVLHPSAINEVRLGTHALKEEDVNSQLIYIALYCIILILSVFISLSLGVDTQNSFAASVASMGNLGPALGDLGTLGSYNSIPGGAKFLYTVDMFLGRIEIYPVLAILAMVFSHKKK